METKKKRQEHINYEALRRLICREVYRVDDVKLLMVIYELLQ